MDGRPSSAYMASNTGDRSASASSARYLIVRSGWSSGMRVSTSTNASMLACGSCRPRITTTSVRDGSTLSGQPLRPEEPETPKMSLFQSPARRGEQIRADQQVHRVDLGVREMLKVLSACRSCQAIRIGSTPEKYL